MRIVILGLKYYNETKQLKVVYIMGELKYRRRITTSVDIELYSAISKYSAATLIPLSRLLDRAIEDLLISCNVEYGKAKEELLIKRGTLNA